MFLFLLIFSYYLIPIVKNVDKLLEVISGEWENEIFEHFVIFLPLETLELVHQRDQTKAQLLYKARTSSILSVDDLHRCKYANCRKLFTLQQHQLLKMQYPECFHCRDGRFNGIAFVTSLADKHGWRDTFWLIWGETKMFRCAKCLRFFKMTDSNGCTHGQHVFHETVPKDITNCIFNCKLPCYIVYTYFSFLSYVTISCFF